MMQERLILAEGFINIISGIGLWFYLVTILLNRTRSLLESRLCLLLAITGNLFVLRGIGYTTGATIGLTPYILFLSTLFPFATVLFIEGLLRQHSPLALKIFTFVSSLILGAWALFFETNNMYFFIGLMGFQASVLVALSYLTITRDKTNLSEAENRLINGVSIACGIAVPLMISDYRSIFGWDFMRLGALGGLVFCLSTIKFSEKSAKREVAKEFTHIILTDLLGTVLFCLIWNEFTSFWIAYATFMAMHLLILILKELTLHQEPKVQEWIFGLVDAIEKDQVHSVEDIYHLLSSKLGDNSLIFADERSLRHYSLDIIGKYLTGKKEISLNDLRRDANTEAAQQLIYALEAHEMNQVYVVTQSPLLLIFANTPSLKGAAAYQREVKILTSFIHLLQRKGTHE